jgi:hypothetical protein
MRHFIPVPRRQHHGPTGSQPRIPRFGMEVGQVGPGAVRRCQGGKPGATTDAAQTELANYDFVGMKLRPTAARLERLVRSMRQKSSPRPKSNRAIVSVAVSPYVLSFESQRFYRGWRYHWMICAARNPDELVSWGHAPTRELAETAAAFTKAQHHGPGSSQPHSEHPWVTGLGQLPGVARWPHRRLARQQDGPVAPKVAFRNSGTLRRLRLA